MELFVKALGSQVSRVAAQRAYASTSANVSATNWTSQVHSRTELDYEELADLLTFNPELALIDVRSPNELDTYGSIPGSINIPLNEVKAALQLPEHEFMSTFLLTKPEKSTKNLVFFARGPNASSAAVEIAHRLGFKGSRQYSGGWEDYCNKTGLPLKKSAKKAKARSTSFMGQSSYNTYSNIFSI